MVKMLIDAKATLDYFNESPLKAACEKLQPASVKMLLDAGAVFNASEGSIKLVKSIFTPQALDDEAITAHTAVLEMLLERWAATVPTARKNAGGDDWEEWPAYDREKKPWDELLHYCGMKGNRAICAATCTALLKRFPELLEFRPSVYFYISPLMTAVGFKRPEMMKPLIDSGARLSDRMISVWFEEPLDREKNDLLALAKPKSLGRLTHDTLRLLLDAGLDPTTYLNASQYRDENNQIQKPSIGTTVLMDLATPPKSQDNYHHREPRMYEFPDSHSSIFIAMILDSILARGK
jgi:hypothetical protein